MNLGEWEGVFRVNVKSFGWSLTYYAGLICTERYARISRYLLSRFI